MSTEEKKSSTMLDQALQEKLDILCRKRDKLYSEWEYHFKASQLPKLKLGDRMKQFQLSEDLHNAFTHLGGLIRKFKEELNGFDPVQNGTQRLGNMEEHVITHNWILARHRPRNSLIRFFETFRTKESETIQLVNDFIEEVTKTIKLASAAKLPTPIDADEASAMLEIHATDFHARNL